MSLEKVLAGARLLSLSAKGAGAQHVVGDLAYRPKPNHSCGTAPDFHRTSPNDGCATTIPLSARGEYIGSSDAVKTFAQRLQVQVQCAPTHSRANPRTFRKADA